MKKWLGYLAVCMALFVPGLSQAEDVQKDKEIVSTMEEVVVTAGRVKEKKKEITSNVTIIDEEEIKISSATDLGDLLAEKGVGHIQKYPGTSTAIGIRGFRTDATGVDLAGHVLILLNGRRAGTGNLAKIMTKNIERVEIIRGPASVQYGSAAMGGVVNVITKKGKGKPSFFVDGGLGSFDHEEGTIGFSGKFKEFDFSGSATRETMDDYDTAEGDDYRNTGYDEKKNASLNLGFEFLPKNHIRLIYNYFDADEVGDPYYLSQNDLNNYTDNGLKSIDFIYNGETTDGLLSWKARYFYGEDEYKWCDPTWAYSYEKDADHQGAQGQVSLHWKDSIITGGFDWVNYDIDSSSTPKESEYDNPAYFILAKTKLFDRFIITGGLRYDDYEVDMKEDGGKEDDDNLSSNFGVAYLVTDYLKVRANYGEAFKMPTADQLTGDVMMGFDHYLGNPDLDPEKSDTYEGGLDFSLASFNLSLTYFYTDFDDKIQVYALPTSEKSYKNIGGATIEGFEGEISFDIGAFFDWEFEIRPYGSIVYLTEYEDDETHEDLLYTEDINACWGIIFSDMKGLSANLNFAYTGEKDVEDWENQVWPEPVEVIKRGGFTVANFTISKKILDFDRYGGVTLKGEILNIFDKDYEYIKGYPMPGRNFFMGMRYDF